MARRNTRLPGHALWGEGKPYAERDDQIVAARPFYSGTGGTGFAVCECGWRSEVLASATKRQYAHRVHKLDVASGQGAE